MARKSFYECGPAEAATGPSLKHYKWHRNRRTAICELSRREAAWYQAERRVGHAIAEYSPLSPLGFECGTADDAERPSFRHYMWHRRRGTAQCGLSRAEWAWYNICNNDGRLPDGAGFVRLQWDIPTAVYQYSFVDGDRYYGITSRDPATRWMEHQYDQSPLGEKIRSGAVFVTEVLCVAPDRYRALEIEEMAIKAGNPWGRLLNRTHNEEAAIYG